MLIFEKKLHFFQYKILLVGMFNTFMILFSYQLNPLASTIVYWVIITPYFSRKSKEIQSQIEAAFENDINFEYYNPFKHKQ